MRKDGTAVLYLIDSLAPGGAERSLVDIGPHLLDRNIDLEVVALTRKEDLASELRENGIPVSYLGKSGRTKQLWGIVDILRSRRPDLLHTTLFESDVLGRVAAALTGTPVVSTFASTPYGSEHAAEMDVKPYRLRAAQLVDATTAKLARRFHAVSRSAADAYIARLRLRPDRVDVIPRGRDPIRLGTGGRERRERVRLALGLEPDRPVISFVGRQEPAKGLNVFLEALPAVIHQFPDAVALVAGRAGRSSTAAIAFIREGRLEPFVRILGERPDVPDLLAASDAYVLSSLREGLPGTILEAMALEVPVVAADLPTVREAVPDERYAALFPAGDAEALSSAIVAALSDSAGTAQRAAASFRRFQAEFDIRIVASRMASFYERALSSKV